MFFSFIHWGLPSRAVDPFLFGDRTPWTGEEILNLLPNDLDFNRGADVDANPISRADAQILLNDTDAKRAEIVRRYRLFSYQPDEVITFMALAQMNPGEGKLDPKLYQYGGLWIYPVGAMLKLSSMLNLVKLESSQAFYLDHPEEFGKFYIVARTYVAIWGLVGVWVIYWLARRMTSDLFTAVAATLCCIFMPVVVNMSHEAKPHLPAAVLTLLAVMSATKYVETGRSRWGIVTGVLCGAAFSMVISALMSFILLPAMSLMVGNKCTMRIRTFGIAVACAFGVYAITNPYVIIHLFGDRTILESNLRNSTAMYGWSFSPQSLLYGLMRLMQAISLPLLVAGLFSLLKLKHGSSAARTLMIIVSIPILIQFFGLAEAKPAEYARFAIFPAITLPLIAFSAIKWSTRSRRDERSIAVALCVAAAVYVFNYLRHFAMDCGGQTSRLIAAKQLAAKLVDESNVIDVRAEPAPYCLPPLDLFRWNIWMDYGHNSNALPDVMIRTVDLDSMEYLGSPSSYEIWGHRWPAPISWAGKPFHVRYPERWLHRSLPSTTQPE